MANGSHVDAVVDVVLQGDGVNHVDNGTSFAQVSSLVTLLESLAVVVLFEFRTFIFAFNSLSYK